MIVKTLEDVVGTKGEAHGDKWHSMRLLHREDGMGVTLTDSVLEAGFEMVLWQKNHLEACYCLEGEGTVEERIHQLQQDKAKLAADLLEESDIVDRLGPEMVQDLLGGISDG